MFSPSSYVVVLIHTFLALTAAFSVLVFLSEALNVMCRWVLQKIRCFFCHWITIAVFQEVSGFQSNKLHRFALYCLVFCSWNHHSLIASTSQGINSEIILAGRVSYAYGWNLFSPLDIVQLSFEKSIPAVVTKTILPSEVCVWFLSLLFLENRQDFSST